MIVGKLWNALRAQMNKIAHYFLTMDPIAQMQLEYDSAVAELKEVRQGLEQYRALVERVAQQVQNERDRLAKLEVKVKATCRPATPQRQPAAQMALWLPAPLVPINCRRGVPAAAGTPGWRFGFCGLYRSCWPPKRYRRARLTARETPGSSYGRDGADSTDIGN